MCTHHDMDLRLGRGLRRIVHFLSLIGHERSRHELQSLERDTLGQLPLHLQAFVRYERHLC